MSMSYRLVHYFDKELQLHKVYEQHIGDNHHNIFTSNITGHGSTKEDAIKDYNKHLRIALRELNNFVQEMVLNPNSMQVSDVDIFGEDIEENN